MTTPDFSQTKACVFDAYGTIFDLVSATDRLSAELGEDLAPKLGELWRTKQLQYSWLRSLTGHYTSFWDVTRDALDYSFEQLGIKNPALKEKLIEGYRALDAYPDVKPILAKLKQAGLKTAILSNGSPDMLASGVRGAGLTDLLDAVLSVEDAGVFKPDYRVYQLACDRFNVSPAAICFLSSNGWDAAGAASFGFKVAWINRNKLPIERLPGKPDAIIRSMDGLPALLGLESI